MLKQLFGFLFDDSKDPAPALVHPEEVTYGALKQAAWSAAAGLKARRARPGVILPVTGRGLNFCAAYFGSLLAGNVPLLMETSDDADLEKAAGRADLVLTDEAGAKRAQGIAPRDKILVLEELMGGGVDPGLSFEGFGKNEPMTILLTSGSTGDPKTTVKTAGTIADELAVLKDLHAAGPSDCYFCAVPWVHIYGLLNGFLLPLSAGAGIMATGAFIPREALALLKKCTVFLGVPIQYKAMTEIGDPGGGPLRLSFSSGAALSTELAGRFKELTGIPVTEIYGSTEMGSVAVRKNPDETGWDVFPVIRWKAGEDNELLIQSPLAEAPAGQGPGMAWYGSGDCIRVLEDGKFELAGRKSDIIKVGGKRVSAREIEEALHRTGLVYDVAVAPYYNRRSCSEKIGAIVVLVEGGDADRRAIRKKCRELLPSFKVPDKIVFVEKIPRTRTGKVRYSDIHTLLKL
ncbi:MAG: class I adenylate-forming enzyme family protein [Pseudomonadota bacterium]